MLIIGVTIVNIIMMMKMVIGKTGSLNLFSSIKSIIQTIGHANIMSGIIQILQIMTIQH